MSKKSGRIAELIEKCRGQAHDAHYLGYFACFNEGLYFEAHDVLEELWLADKKGPNYRFYKGLIQLAGAFVHLQKERLKPASALFRLADDNLAQYPALHDDLDVARIREMIEEWQKALADEAFRVNPLKEKAAPKIQLEGCGGVN